MLFNSFAFFIFAPVFFIFYFVLRGRARLVWCLLASYFFYSWWDWRFVGLIIGSTLVSFFAGRMIGKSRSIRTKKSWLWFCIVSHLGALFFFKYFGFFWNSLQTVFHRLGFDVPFKDPGILLPVGISFFSFTAISYTIDVYRGKICPAEFDLLEFGVFRCLFPQLAAGPIIRAPRILPQLKNDQAFDWGRAGRGMEMIIWGYFLKLCLADNAALFANPRFESPELFTSASLLLAVLVYAFQIYGDFAGYSLIAIGLARVMGFDFGINFDKPYLSAKMSDFWRRWHISLGSWFRDYVFLPIAYALSRRLKEDRYLGLKTDQWLYLISTTVTMTLVGLWHGASWNFIFWGFLHGLFLVGQRLASRPIQKIRRMLGYPASMARLTGTLSVFLLVCISWIFFRSPNMAKAFAMLKSIFSWSSTAHLSFGGMKFQLLRILLIVGIVLVVEISSRRERIRSLVFEHHYLRVALAGLAVVMIFFTGNFSSNSFIYFQF